MQLKFYKPTNELLRKYLEGYYFIQKGKRSDPLHYRTFPNNYTIVTVMQNASLSQDNSKIMIKPSEKKGIYSNMVYRYNSPIEIFYEEPINELTIYFKPLGINFFIENTEIFFAQDYTKEIVFNPFADFKAEMHKILNLHDSKKQLEMLESYWLSKYIEKDISVMKNIIKDIEADGKIDETAKKYNISRQYLNKLFQKNMGKSPSEYRRIHRFRKSMAEKNEIKNLTELSHENLFYDQSHFIRDFRELTHKTPKSFFRNVDVDKEVVWLFI
ncbi:helix-turn-helix domain-containing protein [Chryseobacterium sp.]|uniref:helix-turn-helix domain-containing protein n=1 Tax=Chryseobacterium sp. TaxID=1871047 RepID=UPI002FC66082